MSSCRVTNAKTSKTCAEWAAGGRRYLAGNNY